MPVTPVMILRLQWERRRGRRLGDINIINWIVDNLSPKQIPQLGGFDLSTRNSTTVTADRESSPPDGLL